MTLFSVRHPVISDDTINVENPPSFLAATAIGCLSALQGFPRVYRMSRGHRSSPCPFLSAPLYNSIKRKLGNFPGDSSLSVTFCFARSHTRNSTYVRRGDTRSREKASRCLCRLHRINIERNAHCRP